MVSVNPYQGSDPLSRLLHDVKASGKKSVSNNSPISEKFLTEKSPKEVAKALVSAADTWDKNPLKSVEKKEYDQLISLFRNMSETESGQQKVEEILNEVASLSGKKGFGRFTSCINVYSMNNYKVPDSYSSLANKNQEDSTASKI